MINIVNMRTCSPWLDDCHAKYMKRFYDYVLIILYDYFIR